MTFEALNDLFTYELQVILDAEYQIAEALPKMIDAASLPYLKNKFNDQLTQTQEQITRLEKAFNLLGIPPTRIRCEAIAGLLKDSDTLVQAEGNPAAIDAGLISTAQKGEHYLISAYGTLRTFARTLGRKDVADLLKTTLREEAKADELLTTIAEASINKKAA